MNKYILLGLAITTSITFNTKSMDVRQGFYIPNKIYTRNRTRQNFRRQYMSNIIVHRRHFSSL
jgi:hypothetical protein